MQTKMLPFVRMGVVGVVTLAFCCALFGQTSVLTQHNDLARTGQNVTETILTPSTVSSGGFGKLFTLAVDGTVLAQPLYVPNVTLTAGMPAHNILIVATEHDSIFAFDADSGGVPLWQVSLFDAAHGAAPGATSDPESDSGCGNIKTEYGVTGTPVIDPVTQTIYVVSDTFENGYAVYRLHALDLKTGNEKLYGPATIQAFMSGTGNGSSGGVLKFDPKWQLQRPGLVLVNGQVYIGFGSHCDFGPFHGWLMAYSASTLAQTAVFLTTPNGESSGVWMSGNAPAVDLDGPNNAPRMFLPTGNGTYDATIPYATNSMDYGDDILRLDLSNGIVVSDAFTPMDQATRQASDQDVASGGTLVLPDQTGPYPHLLLQIGKGNEVYIMNRDNMGGYSTTADNIVQEIDNVSGNLWGAPAYWNGNIYVRAAGTSLKQFTFTNGVMSSTPVASAPQVMSSLGSTPSVSANGTTNGIVWVTDWSATPQILYAYDATNVANLLWSSAQNATRDQAGPAVEFAVPTVANGKVYVDSVDEVQVYGMLPNFTFTASALKLNVNQGASGTDLLSVTPEYGFSGFMNVSASSVAGLTTSIKPGSASNIWVVTFTAASTAAPGTYPVTITATSGTLVHSVVVNVNVVGVPNFSLSAMPASLAVQQSSSGITNIAVAAVYGFTGAPTFTIAGLPTGVTASFSPASSASGTALTLKASSTAWVGNFSVVISGTYTTYVRSVKVPLSVTRGLTLTNVQLVNKSSDTCSDVGGISTAAGALVGTWDCWGGPNQVWNLSALTGGFYSLASYNSGLLLDIASGSTSAGSDAIQNTASGSISQMWQFKATSDGYFNVINKNSGMCLDLAGGAITQGTLIVQETCAGSQTQEWSLIPLSNVTQVNMTSAFNINAIGTTGTPAKNGGADGEGDQWAVATLGSQMNFYGINFSLGAANVADAAANKVIALPYGQFTDLYVVAFGVNGPQANQIFKVTYSDGTSDTFEQSVSDWGTPQNYSDEYVALTRNYRLSASGATVQTTSNLYGYDFGLDCTRTPVSLTLPANSNVVVTSLTLGN